MYELSQTKSIILCKSSWLFSMGIYGSKCGYKSLLPTIGLIATSHMLLITSLQPQSSSSHN